MKIHLNKQSFSTKKQSFSTKNQSLLTTAFEILLNNLGPQKTSRLWQILTPLRENYTVERQKLFKRKNLISLYKEAKKFNKD